MQLSHEGGTDRLASYMKTFEHVDYYINLKPRTKSRGGLRVSPWVMPSPTPPPHLPPMVFPRIVWLWGPELSGEPTLTCWRETHRQHYTWPCCLPEGLWRWGVQHLPIIPPEYWTPPECMEPLRMSGHSALLPLCSAHRQLRALSAPALPKWLVSIFGFIFVSIIFYSQIEYLCPTEICPARPPQVHTASPEPACLHRHTSPFSLRASPAANPLPFLLPPSSGRALLGPQLLPLRKTRGQRKDIAFPSSTPLSALPMPTHFLSNKASRPTCGPEFHTDGNWAWEGTGGIDRWSQKCWNNDSSLNATANMLSEDHENPPGKHVSYCRRNCWSPPTALPPPSKQQNAKASQKKNSVLREGATHPRLQAEPAMTPPAWLQEGRAWLVIWRRMAGASRDVVMLGWERFLEQWLYSWVRRRLRREGRSLHLQCVRAHTNMQHTYMYTQNHRPHTAHIQYTKLHHTKCNHSKYASLTRKHMHTYSTHHTDHTHAYDAHTYVRRCTPHHLLPAFGCWRVRLEASLPSCSPEETVKGCTKKH